MNRKFLEELGLEKDQINSIMEKNGEDLEKQKEKLAQKDEEIRGLKANIEERDKDIEDLKKADDKVSKEDYETLQNKYKELEKTSKENVANVTKNFLIDKVLSNSKAKNVDVLRKQIDFDKVKLDGDKITGLDDQIEALQKSDSYLFNTDDKNKTVKLNGDLNNDAPKNEAKDLRSALHQKYDK